MKSIIKKELFLSASPLSYFFILFSFMSFIPGYPILVSSFFICLGIFYSFQSARESNDILYTALLPIKKSDVVTAKFAFTVIIQIFSFTLDLIITLIRMCVLNSSDVYLQNAMMNSNFVYLGFTLVIFALFNLFFLCGFFKTSYYIGKPFIVFGIAALLAVFAGESLHHIPGLEYLNATGFENITIQIIFFASGAAIYIIFTAVSLHISKKNFNKTDF
ncbi:MAG: ABC-2 transporter permease [Clostridia bacterium]|nr:ABC-2 transporter permease [Clostridia bacterium]